MSVPSWVDKGHQVVQVMEARGDTVLLGSRQFVKTATVDETCLSVTRSMKSVTATTALAFHPLADSVLAAAGSNGEVSLWYYGAQNVAPLIEKWTAHSRAIHAMEFLPNPSKDAALLVTASADGDLNVWELCTYRGKKETWRKPTLVCNPRAARSGLRDLDARLDAVGTGFELIVACDDGSIEVHRSVHSLDVRAIKFAFRVSISTQTVNSVKFRGPLFATGGKDSYIRIFRMEHNSASQICSIRCLSSVWAVRWRPNPTGRLFVAACHSVMDSNIYVWDLHSRLMPAFVFNSHRDSVTDFFWLDPYHLLACARDGTVQMHALARAVVPIEKMRTVNICFALNGCAQMLTSLCDTVNRDATSATASATASGEELGQDFDDSNHLTDISLYVRELVRRPVPLGLCVEIVSSLIEFIADIARASTRQDVSRLCEKFSSLSLTGWHTQAELVGLVGWLLAQEPGTSNSVILPAVLREALTVYRGMNDVVMALTLGSICVYSTHVEFLSLVDSSEFVRWCASLLGLLRKMQKWQLAADFIFHSPLAEIRSLSHSRTGLSLACASCKRECELGSAKCSKCAASLADCMLCGEKARGLFLTCPGCGHGGHMHHVTRWFSNNTVCPTPNCGHVCR